MGIITEILSVMKTRYFKLLSLSILATATLSCQKDDDGAVNEEVNKNKTIPGEIAFSATTCGTKAFVNVSDSTTTANLETVYVAAAYDSTAEGTTVAHFAENQTFTNAKFIRYLEDDTFKFHGDPNAEGGTKYWPKQADPHYYFYASNIELEHALDQVADSASFVTVNASDKKDVVCTFSAYDPAHTNWKKENKLTMHHIFARITDVTVSAPDNASSVSNLKITFTPVYKGRYYLKKGNVDVSEERDGIEKMKTMYKDKGIEGWQIDTTLTPEDTVNLVAPSSATIEKGQKPVVTRNDFYLVPGFYELTAAYTLSKGGSVPVNFIKTAKVQIVRGMMNRIKTTLPKSDVEEIVFIIEVNQWHNYDIDIPSTDWQ